MLVILRLLDMTHTKIFFWQSSSSNSYLMSTVVTPGCKTARAWGHEVDRSPCTPVPRLRKRGPIHVLPLYAFMGLTVTVKTKLQAWHIKLSAPILNFLLKMGIFLLALTIPVDLSSELGHHSMTDMYLQLLQIKNQRLKWLWTILGNHFHEALNSATTWCSKVSFDQGEYRTQKQTQSSKWQLTKDDG